MVGKEGGGRLRKNIGRFVRTAPREGRKSRMVVIICQILVPTALFWILGPARLCSRARPGTRPVTHMALARKCFVHVLTQFSPSHEAKLAEKLIRVVRQNSSPTTLNYLHVRGQKRGTTMRKGTRNQMWLFQAQACAIECSRIQPAVQTTLSYPWGTCIKSLSQPLRKMRKLCIKARATNMVVVANSNLCAILGPVGRH